VTDFDQFWHAYPRKFGKLAARKAFDKAIKNGATLTQILAGIGLYLQYKPVYADYCHPASWLNAGRWMDEWTDPYPTSTAKEDWFDECKRVHGGACGLSRWRHHDQMQIAKLRA
jgi:hypothetical protein